MTANLLEFKSMALTVRSAEMRATEQMLQGFRREDLRELAQRLDVERGQNKADTVRNLIKSGKVRATVRLYFNKKGITE